MHIFSKIIVTIMAFLLSSSQALACTSFLLHAQDGTVLITRSMEFAEDMQSHLITKPRESVFNLTAPNGKPSLSWVSQYGYVFLDGLNLGVPLDGMNEMGLSIEVLLFPEEADYQTIPKGQEKQALSYLHLGDWILGHFKNVDEVRSALNHIYVFEEKVPQLNNTVFPVHYSIFDASGKGIVVEYVAGKLNIYDHMGVMTNSPTYDWQVTNLRNYIQLSPSNPKPVIANGITYTATGQGSGMIGLPGDISPPSRFVKMAVMLKTVLQPKNAQETLNLSQHMINNVDIPLGFVRVSENKNTATTDSTQWVVFKDLTHKKFYYRTYDDLSIRVVDLNKLDFLNTAKPLKMPIAAQNTVIEMSDQFLATGK